MTRKSLIAMFLSSIIGGVVAIILFTTLVPRTNLPAKRDSGNPVTLTNYVFDSANFVVPEGLNFVFAAKSATPSVVHIRTTYTGNGGANNPVNEFFREYFGDEEGRYNDRSRGAGSGVILSADGYIVTNNHVVEDAVEIEVLLNDNRSYKGKIIGTDPTTDLAVIKIKEDNLRAVQIGSSEDIQIGEWVLAIGNPFEFRSTVTAGIVSAKARNINILTRRDRLQIESFIQTDAAVNPGNSGGALVNLKGALVGINTAIASPTGAYAGYSFAIPASLVQKVAADLIEFGTIQRGLLGISIRDVDAEIADELELDIVQGVYVQEVMANQAADEAGMTIGDVVIGIGDKNVSSVAELQEQVALNRPGDRIKVKFIRDGKVAELFATLKNTSGTTNVVEFSNTFRREGATFEEVSGSEMSELRIEGGVQVTKLENGKWKTAGMKKGFIITRVDKTDIRSLEQFINLINDAKGDGLLIEGYYPSGEKAYYGIGW
ncbi:MAG: Do family serine endopeptidase [Cytophagales bacterium]|nr:Do family serine endopeptidase [Cytophagales bacterium]